MVEWENAHENKVTNMYRAATLPSSPEDKPHTCSTAKSIKKDTIRNEQEATRLRTTTLAGDMEEG